jgi:hypothetical protein
MQSVSNLLQPVWFLTNNTFNVTKGNIKFIIMDI